MKTSWRKPPTAAISMPGKIDPRSSANSGDSPSCDDERLAGSGDQQSEQAQPEAPRQRGRQERSERAVRRATQADERPWEARRWHGGRRADVATDERLDADDQERDREERDDRDRRPVELAGQRDMGRGPAPPGQVRERREGRDRVAVAIEDEPGEHDRPGDADGGAAADELGQGEGQRAGRPGPAIRATAHSPPRRAARSRRPATYRRDRRRRPPGRRAASPRRAPPGGPPASRWRRDGATSATPRRTRGCRAALPRRACRTARGWTTGWQRAGRTCRTCTTGSRRACRR